MEKRLRSPNYPALSLKEAVEKVRKLAEEIGQRSADRETVAVGMGYSGLSGASASAISALHKYGLIQGRGGDVSVTDRAMTILYPASDNERSEALREAAKKPELFKDLAGRFGDNVKNEELLRNYLLRNKFAPNAVDAAISAYKETVEFIGGFSEAYDLASEPNKETVSTPEYSTASGNTRSDSPPASISEEGEVVASYGNKDRGFVFIKATHGMSAKEAMAMAKRAIKSFEDEEKELGLKIAPENIPSEPNSVDQ